MKALLDENLDHRLRRSLTPHEVFTASYMGFDGLKNGSLLRAVEDGGFDVLVSGDKSLYYEQNLVGRRLAVVVLSAVQFAILEKHLAKIVLAIDGATPGSFQAVDCGTFSRKKAVDE